MSNQTPDTLRAALTDDVLWQAIRGYYGPYSMESPDLPDYLHRESCGRMRDVLIDVLSREAPTPEPGDFHDIEPNERVVRVYRDGSYLLDVGGRRKRFSFTEAPTPEPLDRAALIAAVEQLKGYEANELDDMLQKADRGWLVSRADVLRLLTGGTERSGA